MRMSKILLAGSALMALSTAAYAWEFGTTFKITNDTTYGDPHHNKIVGVDFLYPGHPAHFTLDIEWPNYGTVTLTEREPCKSGIKIYMYGLPSKAAPGIAPGPFTITADALHAPYLFDACHSHGITVSGHDTVTYN